MTETTFTVDKETNSIVMERVFNAPREKVWQAWTDAETFATWWGPRGWETTVKQLQFEPDGILVYGMKCVDPGQKELYGQESWGKAVYRTIDEPNGFSYIDYFSDSQGNTNDSMPASPVSLAFIEEDGCTRLISHSSYETAEALQQVLDMGVETGAREAWDRLAETLETS